MFCCDQLVSICCVVSLLVLIRFIVSLLGLVCRVVSLTGFVVLYHHSSLALVGSTEPFGGCDFQFSQVHLSSLRLMSSHLLMDRTTILSGFDQEVLLLRSFHTIKKKASDICCFTIRLTFFLHLLLETP